MFSSLFAYLNKLDRSPFQQSRFNKHFFLTFICLKISTFLFADTYSLRSQANCMALTRTTSANSQHDKQTLTWGFNSLKLLHENYTVHICNSCIVFHFFVSKTISYQCSRHSVIFMIFSLFWWLVRTYFKPTFAL